MVHDREELDTLIFASSTLLLGILCSIPGVIAGRLLASNGIARDTSFWLIAVNIAGLFLERLLFPALPIGWLIAMHTLLSPLGIYRHDLWTTFRRGRWWWVNGIHSDKNDLHR